MSDSPSSHEFYMKMALDEAIKSTQKVSPNPRVGAVIVKNNVVLSKGYHEAYGAPHAEINAINNAKENLEGSSIYITLQPCTHHGKTPPCTDAIIKHKIKNVYFAMLDPNPQVAFKNGLETLKKNNINVHYGFLKREAEAINQPFIKSFKDSLPYISLKYAMTLDGKIATSTNDSKWITNEASRKETHILRSQHDAILIGRNTFEKDDPQLNIRYDLPDTNPFKIVCASEFRNEYLQFKLCSQKPEKTMFLLKKPPEKYLRPLMEERGISFCLQKNNLSDTLKILKTIGIQSVFCEGGGELAGALFDEKLIDKVDIFIGQKLIGGLGHSPIKGKGIDLMSQAMNLIDIQTQIKENDIHISGFTKFYGS